MSKNASPTPTTPPPASPSPQNAATPNPTPKVKLVAINTFNLGGMIIAPGCEFLATEAKATELEAAGVAKRGILTF